MLKITTDKLTMTSNDRYFITNKDLQTGLARPDRQCDRTRTQTTFKKENIKNPSFAFLKIYTNVHCTHLQSRIDQPATKALQKSAILTVLPQFKLKDD